MCVCVCASAQAPHAALLQVLTRLSFKSHSLTALPLRRTGSPFSLRSVTNCSNPSEADQDKRTGEEKKYRMKGGETGGTEGFLKN